MQVIEKESFAFELLNDLVDNHNLHMNDYTDLVKQIWDANGHKRIDGILAFLQGSLLLVLRPKGKVRL